MSIFNFNPYKYESQTINGFLLLEISVTLVIIMLLSLYACNWYSNLQREYVIFDQKSQALRLACNFIERYRALKNFNINNYNNLNKSLVFNVSLEKDKGLKNFAWLIVTVTLKENFEKIIIKTGVII